MKRLILVLVISLLVIISIGTAFANDNTTEPITDNATNTNYLQTFSDIQAQIDDASENATIELEGTYQSTGKAIELNKSITITSKNGATLDGQFKSNIFNISNVNVCLKNLNFINSQSETTSAIYNQGNLTIINSNFANNSIFNQDIGNFILGDTSRSAGAIYSTNYLNIQGCGFEDNHAETLMQDYEYLDGGEYLSDLGGSIFSQGTTIINKSRFKQDYIESYNSLIIINSEFIASNIYCYSNTSIINSTFAKNPDYTSVIQTTSNLNVTSCNFTNNGGYVINSESYDENMCKIIIDNCNFINNNLKSAGCYDFSDDEFNEESNTVFGEGSDIYVYNSNFKNNTANAINNHDGNLFVQNSTFTKNSGYAGGAISSHNTTVISSTFEDNTASFAGAIHTTTLILENCNFTNNNEGAIGAEKTAIINGERYSGLNYFNNSLNKIKLITSNVGKLTTTYQSGKTVWIKLSYTESKHPFKYQYVNLKITKGKKVYYDDVYTNSKGIGYYKASNLAVGTYKITFSYDEELVKISTTVKITKAKTIIKAPKVTGKYKKTKYFKITVKNKFTKKAVKNTYVNVKIAKKTYKLKTNSKGIVKFNTKKLKIGKHKVSITSGSTNYQMSGKSTITIKK